MICHNFYFLTGSIICDCMGEALKVRTHPRTIAMVTNHKCFSIDEKMLNYKNHHVVLV